MIIRNLGKEIHQDKDPYCDLKECGVIHAQINSIIAMYSTLNINHEAHSLSIHACGFSGSYAFLP